MGRQITIDITRKDAEHRALQKLYYQISMIQICSDEMLADMIEEDFYNYNIIHE